MRTGLRTASLTVEAAFGGDTADLTAFGKLDPAVTTTLSDMLALTLGKRPRALVLHIRKAGPISCVVTEMVADASRTLPGAAWPVIVRRSRPLRSFSCRSRLGAVAPVGPLEALMATVQSAPAGCSQARASFREEASR